MVNTSSSARVIRQQAPRSTAAWPRLLVRWIKTGEIRRKSSYIYLFNTHLASVPDTLLTPLHSYSQPAFINERKLNREGLFLFITWSARGLIITMFMMFIVFIIAFMSKKIWLLIKKLPHPYVFCGYLHLHHNNICRSNNTQLLYKSSPDSSCSTIYIPTNSGHEDTRTYTRCVRVLCDLWPI